MSDIIGDHVSAWKDKGGIYNLSQGIVYWKPPKSAIEAVQAALNDETVDGNPLHIYSPNQGLPELTQLLEQRLQTVHHQQTPLTNHRVMITAGANQAYVNCILTLMDEAHKAVVFAPYYFNHVMTLQMCCGEQALLIGPSISTLNSKELPEQEQQKQQSEQLGWPDLDWLETQLQENVVPDNGTNLIRVVTIVNPDNPTGTSLSREHLQRAVDLTRQYGSWLIFDCTYRDFIHDQEQTGSRPFVGCFDAETHVIHIFSLSKSHGMAGYRCGYIALHKDVPDLYEEMNKVQDCIAIGVSRLSQVAALGALQGAPDGWVRDKVATLAPGRRAILDALQCGLQSDDEKESQHATVMGGSGSMYVMAKLPWTEDDVSVAKQLVADFGVAVIPGSFCGAPGWIRVCYANLPPEKCIKAAQRLQQGLLALKVQAASST